MSGLEMVTRAAIAVLVFGSTAVFVWFLLEVGQWRRSDAPDSGETDGQSSAM